MPALTPFIPDEIKDFRPRISFLDKPEKQERKQRKEGKNNECTRINNAAKKLQNCRYRTVGVTASSQERKAFVDQIATLTKSVKEAKQEIEDKATF